MFWVYSWNWYLWVIIVKGKGIMVNVVVIWRNNFVFDDNFVFNIFGILKEVNKKEVDVNEVLVVKKGCSEKW